jgi:hypothetical protein
MSAYGIATDPNTLLTTMRDKARQDDTKLSYLAEVKIINAFNLVSVKTPGLYLFYHGSPEEIIGEAPTQLLVATHHVRLIPVIYVPTPFDEVSVLGTDTTPGITTIVADIIDFYANNYLGLTGLHNGLGPTVHLPANSINAYPLDADESEFLVTAVMDYEAKTRAFKRDRVA